MSLHGWGDGDDGDPHEGWVTEDRAEEMFIEGAQAMREMLARFVEQGGHVEIANSIRLNWKPSWGRDPGRPETVAEDAWNAYAIKRNQPRGLSAGEAPSAETVNSNSQAIASGDEGDV